MNELLGWYGFDSVDRLDLSAKTSKFLQTSSIISGGPQQHQHQHQAHHLEKRRSCATRTASSVLNMQQQQKQQQQQQQQQHEHLRTLNNNNHKHSNNNNNFNPNTNNNSHNNNCSSSNNRKSSFNCKNNSSTYRGNDSTTSDHDTRSSRDDDSKSPHSAGKIQSTASNEIDDKLVDYENCCWCRRPVPENAPEFLTTSDGPRYCSESCFAQSRRASFKKAKTCDWCKHVRHAVSYVDFQDGASQLQFCSDKCLNQYKMQIFCKETQAHLDMNPHLKEQGMEAVNNGANLITPDLWLKNCRSRSASPASTVSVSPGPTSQANVSLERSYLSAGAPSPPPKLSIAGALPTNSNTSHKPLISVAPVSKLMSKSPSILPSRHSPKHNRKKRPVRSCVSTEIGGGRLTEVKPNTSASLVSTSNKPKPLLVALGENTRSNLNQANTQTLTQFAASCVQDLHMNVPPLSPMMDSHSSQPTTPHSLPPTPNRGPTTIPAAFFATPPTNPVSSSSQPVGITPHGFAQPPAFLHNPNAGFVPRFFGLPPPVLPTPVGLMPPDLAALNSLIGTPPPVTVMVPYPVIIPLPIPVPVPLPIVDFYKAHLTPEQRKKYDEEQQNKFECKITLPPLTEGTEEPLDFTKTKEAENEVEEETAKETSRTSIDEQDEDMASTSKINSKEEETSTITSTPSDDSESTSKLLHCVLNSEESENGRRSSSMSTIKLKSDFVANPVNEVETEIESNTTAGGEINQKLPKLKITRLQTKRTLIQTKESECSRPLRKRKRIIDCDFQKLGASNNNSNNNNSEPSDLANELDAMTENEQINKGLNTNNTNNNNKK